MSLQPTHTTGNTPAMPTRFALYGHAPALSATGTTFRMQEWQDSLTARELIEPRGGQVVIRYYDLEPEGRSRFHRDPWGQRPQARALLDALTIPIFDAVIITKITTRTFGGSCLWNVAALLHHYGKQLWIGDLAGPLDPTAPAHVLLMKILGGACPDGGGA
ncbi:recombinase family protein [Actinomadura macrotermitis]|uniref:Resolvase/invertase-type recombinase catalytic domain-containing protein n=1 Tax=Actinomadura macrotermitis TaxID=2585200 RepID=A0A7K0BTL8_9ACTN|nr:hypothetical protein [Actinomadura macrotermitis]MQY04535.1 hypothetical protein [Actinomadura macrotermitis]